MHAVTRFSNEGIVIRPSRTTVETCDFLLRKPSLFIGPLTLALNASQAPIKLVFPSRRLTPCLSKLGVQAIGRRSPEALTHPWDTFLCCIYRHLCSVDLQVLHILLVYVVQILHICGRLLIEALSNWHLLQIRANSSTLLRILKPGVIFGEILTLRSAHMPLEWKVSCKGMIT